MRNILKRNDNCESFSFSKMCALMRETTHTCDHRPLARSVSIQVSVRVRVLEVHLILIYVRRRTCSFLFKKPKPFPTANPLFF